MTIKQKDFEYLNKQFRNAGPEDIVRWSVNNLVPDLAIMSSFQISGMVILDFLCKETKDIPVYFIDTGYHFPETLKFRDTIIQEYGIEIRTVNPSISHENFELEHGKELYNTNHDLCCSTNKIEPQERAMSESGYHHWISGIRKDQSPERANHEVFMRDPNGHIRVHPLLNWKWSDVWKYLKDNNVPYHPLYDFGYSSIGCSPESCTAPVVKSDDERSGRWMNGTKTECGLHNKLSTETDINKAS